MATQLLQREAQVVVVDPAFDDYLALVAETGTHDTDWRHFETADELLRNWPLGDVLCWIVHAELPDLRGTELARVLADRRTRSPVLVVSDEYRVETEVEVLASGVAHYACKPISMEMFSRHARRLHRPRCNRRSMAAGGHAGES